MAFPTHAVEGRAPCLWAAPAPSLNKTLCQSLSCSSHPKRGPALQRSHSSTLQLITGSTLLQAGLLGGSCHLRTRPQTPNYSTACSPVVTTPWTQIQQGTPWAQAPHLASITDLCHTDSLRFPSHQVFVLPRHLPTTSPLSNHRKTLLCHRKVQLELSELPGSAPSLSKPQLLSLPPCWYQFTRGHLKPPSARSLWCRGHKLLTAPSLFCLPFGHTQPRAFHQLFPD